jgi:hypothetical protein
VRYRESSVFSSTLKRKSLEKRKLNGRNSKNLSSPRKRSRLLPKEKTVMINLLLRNPRKLTLSDLRLGSGLLLTASPRTCHRSSWNLRAW